MTTPGAIAPAVRVRTFYPADPAGVVPGGVDTFIRGLIKWAPADVAFSVVGMTTDAVARPVGQWSTCRIGARTFDFMPLIAVADAGRRSRWPLSVRYTAALFARRGAVRSGFDVFEFHRIEPAIAFLRDERPKNAFFHQDMGIIRTERKADILWKHLPGAYFALESRIVSRLAAAWCVRESGAAALRQRYPAAAGSIRFIPTWVDSDVFSPIDESARQALRQDVALRERIDVAATWVISVGRLDTQKDPELMLGAFARLVREGRDLRWLVVGDGALRDAMLRQAIDSGVSDRVHFMGLRAPSAIADLLRCADVYGLSSAYEGMPMALLEALGSGLPVVTTDVGEVRRVVRTGVNGVIAAERSAAVFAAALRDVIDNRVRWRGSPCVESVRDFQPAAVLAPVYERYRDLGGRRGAMGRRPTT